MPTKVQSKATSNIITDVVFSSGSYCLRFGKSEIILSDEAYLSGYYYPGKELTTEEKKKLISLSKNQKAGSYLSALLVHHRYTEKEVTDKIRQHFSLNQKEISLLLNPYIEAKIIDDYSYAQDFITEKKELGYGRKYLLQHLRFKGISKEILQNPDIEQLLSEDQGDIIFSIVQSYDQKHNNYTIEKRKNCLMNLLLRRGYEINQAKKTIDDYFNSFSDEEIETEHKKRLELLISVAKKCYNSLLGRKADKEKIKNAFIRRMINEGFTYEEIKYVIEKERYYYD
ncbi:MAG: RecX family transcriptional regulator [Bacilli bacterium]